uniref:Inhibitory synaptic factor 2A n=1 Tax=Astyanax mexicanus TaxID=7994 RepID=W5KWS7_ASTMX
MVSKEAGRCALSNSESDSESGGPTLGAEGGGRGDAVRKRNKALQVRFKDICEAQNEAARLARGAKGRSVSCKVVHRRYMTMPARRSIPNVTKSTAVQTSPDLKKRYQTFPFERKKGHTIKHTALVENYQGQNNGFLSDVKSPEEEQPCGGRVQKTRVLLHSMPPCSDVQDLCAGAGDCIDSDLCADPTDRSRDSTANSDQTDLRKDGRFQGTRESESQEPNCTQSSTSPPPPTQQPLQDRGGSLKVTGPIAWTSLTQVECLESPSVRCKRKKESAQFNGLQSQTLPHPPRCSSQETSQAHFHGSHGFTSRVAEETAAAGLGCGEVIPLPGVEGDVKARLQAMETLISSSQETIKVALTPVTGTHSCYWHSLLLLELIPVTGTHSCYWNSFLLLALTPVTGTHSCYWHSLLLLELIPVTGTHSCYWNSFLLLTLIPVTDTHSCYCHSLLLLALTPVTGTHSCYWNSFLLLELIPVTVTHSCYWNSFLLLALTPVTVTHSCYWNSFLLLELIPVTGTHSCYWNSFLLLALIPVTDTHSCY